MKQKGAPNDIKGEKEEVGFIRDLHSFGMMFFDDISANIDLPKTSLRISDTIAHSGHIGLLNGVKRGLEWHSQVVNSKIAL